MRQVSIAWRARRWTLARRCVRRNASPCARTMSASSSRGRTRETTVPDGTARTAVALWRRREPLEQIERGVGAHVRVAGQLKVAGRRTDVRVPEEPLNRVDVNTRFEEVRRKGVTQPVNAAGLLDARAELGLLKHALKRDRKSTRLNSSHIQKSRMPSSA